MKKVIVYILTLFSVASVMAQNNIKNLEKALQYIDKKDYANAIKSLEKELELNDENTLEIMGLLGYANYCHENYAKAMSLFDRTIEYSNEKDSTFLSKMYYHRAGLNLAIGDTVSSVKDYISSISLEPKNEKAIVELAELYFNENQYKYSDEMYLKLIDIDPTNSYPYYGLARNAYNQERFFEAGNWIDKASVLDSDKEWISLMRMRLGMISENYDEALNQGINIISMNSVNEDAYYAILQCSDYINDDVISGLKAKKDNDPDNGIWNYILSHVYIRHGQFKDAIVYLKKLIKKDDTIRNAAFYWLADCYEKMDEQTMVIEVTNKAIDLDSTNVEYYIKRADAKFYEQDLEDAEKDYRKIIELDKSYAYYGYYRLGWIREMQKRYNEALDFYDMGILLNEDFAYTYMMKGNLLKDYFHDTYNATIAFRKCIEIDEGIDENTCKQYAYLALGDTIKAIEITDSILKMANDPGVYYDAACIYSRMGNKEEAVTYLKQAFEKGFKRIKHILNDNDLDNIRNSSSFKKLLKSWMNRI